MPKESYDRLLQIVAKCEMPRQVLSHSSTKRWLVDAEVEVVRRVGIQSLLIFSIDLYNSRFATWQDYLIVISLRSSSFSSSIPIDDNERYPILVYVSCASAGIRFDRNINPIPYLCEAKRGLWLSRSSRQLYFPTVHTLYEIRWSQFNSCLLPPASPRPKQPNNLVPSAYSSLKTTDNATR